MLELKNISKAFNGRPVLKDVNVTIEDGKTLAIVGPSGAGKTTLLRIISGLESADGGTMIWNGQPTTAQALRKQGVIGVVFQNFELFPICRLCAILPWRLLCRGLINKKPMRQPRNF